MFRSTTFKPLTKPLNISKLTNEDDVDHLEYVDYSVDGSDFSSDKEEIHAYCEHVLCDAKLMEEHRCIENMISESVQFPIGPLVFKSKKHHKVVHAALKAILDFNSASNASSGDEDSSLFTAEQIETVHVLMKRYPMKQNSRLVLLAMHDPQSEAFGPRQGIDFWCCDLPLASSSSASSEPLKQYLVSSADIYGKNKRSALAKLFEILRAYISRSCLCNLRAALTLDAGYDTFFGCEFFMESADKVEMLKQVEAYAEASRVNRKLRNRADYQKLVLSLEPENSDDGESGTTTTGSSSSASTSAATGQADQAETTPSTSAATSSASENDENNDDDGDSDEEEKEDEDKFANVNRRDLIGCATRLFAVAPFEADPIKVPKLMHKYLSVCLQFPFVSDFYGLPVWVTGVDRGYKHGVSLVCQFLKPSGVAHAIAEATRVQAQNSTETPSTTSSDNEEHSDENDDDSDEPSGRPSKRARITSEASDSASTSTSSSASSTSVSGSNSVARDIELVGPSFVVSADEITVVPLDNKDSNQKVISDYQLWFNSCTYFTKDNLERYYDIASNPPLCLFVPPNGFQ